MKKCNHCGAELQDELLICPDCGAELTQEAPELEPAPELESAAEAPVEETDEEIVLTEKENSETPEKKKKPLGLIIGLIVAALLLVAAIVIKSQYDSGKKALEQAAAEVGAHHINAYGYGSYSIHYTTNEDGTVSYSYMDANGKTVTLKQKEIDKLMDQVVATCGEMVMTNRQLPFYYSQHFASFYSSYGSLLGSFMNTAQGMDEQISIDGTQTWQRGFLQGGAELFQLTAAKYLAAVEADYTLTAEEQATIDAAVDVAALASQYGFTDPQAFAEAYMGPGCSAEDYAEYMRISYVGDFYLRHLMNTMEVTEEQAEAFYDANVDDIVSRYNVEKVEKPMVDVRHILIEPAFEQDPVTGLTKASDEAWAAAEAEANRIYEEWIADGASEEAFIQLVTTYSTDTGSNTNGGLYEDVYPGLMVLPFNDWCFADGRAYGDHGVVKTNYGYHIMFYVEAGDQIYWRELAENLYKSDAVTRMTQDLVTEYGSEIHLENAILMDYNVPTAPAPEAEPTEPTEPAGDTTAAE